ncbi:lytic transglycosylase domain-containing protein [Pantoea sp. 18069]|uniref:lytic transglycosylase domain-containing protein n=1 Tax=Pantoea sp. 18069 TaxID=2681415 RepID=UPI0013590A12|nr:lytic transglycosylase domain-containing protein [Pantoea sp. 18069]
MPASAKPFAAVRTFASDVTDGFLQITHNGFALLGLAVAFVAITLFARPDLRHEGEAHLRDWLRARQVAVLDMPTEPGAIDRATASNPKDLPREQAAVAFWLSKKYRVAPEPLAALVSEAYTLGQNNKIDPTLILAIMAIESSFNPFAQSSVGAQGLMQVMTSVHTDKYENFGGRLAAFDPVTNLRVGVKVLKDCIARAGSIEGGLRHYVGAANLPNDGGYASKVLAEHNRLRQAAGLRALPAATPPQPLLTAAAKQATPQIAPLVAPAAAPVASAGEQVALNTNL